MTLLDEIRATVPADVLALQDTQVIADLLSIGRTKRVETMVGYGAVMDALGPTNGAAFLDALETVATQSRAVWWALKLIDRGGLDIALDSTRGALDALVGQHPAITRAACDALLALADRPDPFPEDDVRRACKADDGTWMP